MGFIAHWKKWIRPLATVVYIIVLLIAIPLCVVEVIKYKNKDETHVTAWFIGGVFVLMTVPISVWEIIQHIINYTQPNLQKHIIRIVWMVPIYSLNAWFALRFKEAAIYLDTLRECYEAYVIYNFMAYLLAYLWETHPQLHLVLSKRPQQKHIIPFCCFKPWGMGMKIIQNCKHGALQYTVVRPVITVIALICQLCGKYNEGDISFQSAWLYLAFINNISQIWAMYCLVLFYKTTKDLLAPIKPIPKFLCVKFVVFFSFWQSVLLAFLIQFKLLPESSFYGSDLGTALQDLFICVEMFIAAIAHYYSFSHRPFIDPDSETDDNCCSSFMSMWDVTDMKEDVVEHVKVISSKMKKTVSKPFLPRPASTETTPLLQDSTPEPSTSTLQTQVTQADVHHQAGYQSANLDTMSNASDWDCTSIDKWSNQHVAQSTTSSMQNFLDMSTTDETQSIQSSREPDILGRSHSQASLSIPAGELTNESVTATHKHSEGLSEDTSKQVLAKNRTEEELIDFGVNNEGDNDAAALDKHEERNDCVDETLEISNIRASEESEIVIEGQGHSVDQDSKTVSC